MKAGMIFIRTTFIPLKVKAVSFWEFLGEEDSDLLSIRI
jgi:hypothetical protein